jgi:hypothetical protein
MAKKSKNPAQFSEDEMKLINGITLSLAIKLHDCIQNYNDPEKYSKDLSKILESDNGMAFGTLFFSIINMNSDQPLVPAEINKKLAETLAEESQGYLNSPNLSKALKSFKNAGLFCNERGKQNIKQQLPKSVPRKRKKGEPRREGYPSDYYISNKVKDYKKILSKPEAIELINQMLKELIPDLLEKAYYTMFMISFHAVKKANERMDKLFTQAIPKSVGYGTISTSKWNVYREHLLSCDKTQLEELAKESTDHFLENPYGPLFLVLSLPDWQYD